MEWNLTKNIWSNSVQPLQGCFSVFFYPQLHWGLFVFDPCGVVIDGESIEFMPFQIKTLIISDLVSNLY